MEKNKIILFLILLISPMLGACFTTTVAPVKKSTPTRTSAAPVYNPYIYRLYPEYFVYHPKGTESRLYTKLYFKELMFAPIGPKRKYQAKVKIEYYIYKPDDLKNHVDSATVTYEIRKRKGQNNVITYIKIADKGLTEYYMHVKTSDRLRRSTAEEFIYVNKENESSGQNFLVTLKKNSHPYFKRYFGKNDNLLIRHKNKADSIYVRYYKERAPMPNPPFSDMAPAEINTMPDSFWVENGNDAFNFNYKEEGRYFIQTDTTSGQGLCLINSGKDYPVVKYTSSMVHPLAYLCSTQEYDSLLNSSNKKLALDRFWYNCGGNMNRARELIRIYYTRVLYANIYFNSYTEGWNTDRGMIYMMFGPPRSVKKSPDKEIWYYSDKRKTKILQFVFNRTPNPFTNNHFVLDRHLDFRRFWFKAVESWRKGKVYTVFY